MVDESQPKPHREPEETALLIAAVSSVTPSPDHHRSACFCAEKSPQTTNQELRTSCAKVLHITENLEVRIAICSFTVSWNTSEPIAPSIGSRRASLRFRYRVNQTRRPESDQHNAQNDEERCGGENCHDKGVSPTERRWTLPKNLSVTSTRSAKTGLPVRQKIVGCYRKR
jgi:hypothetical protein